MHNESLADATPEPEPVVVKLNKLNKIKRNAVVVGYYTIPAVATGVAIYFGAKLGATAALKAVTAQTAQNITQS